MRWILVFALAACASQHVLAIDGVTLVDAVHPGVREMTVVVRDNTIVAVGPRAATPIPRGARVIDGRGKYLIPGLWDAHVHLVDVDEPGFGALVAAGVTSVRDMGGDVAKLRAWRAAAAAHRLIAPRIRFCGPMLEGTPDALPAGRTDHWLVSDPAAARETVARLAAAGVDCIKLRSYRDPATYHALADAARSHHLPFVGHAPFGLDPLEAAAAGQASFEHGFYPWPWITLDVERQDAIAVAFRAHGVLVTPTLIAWQPFLAPDDTIRVAIEHAPISRALRKNWLAGFDDIKKMRTPDPKSHAAWIAALDAEYVELRDLHERGVGVMVGTDTGTTLVIPGRAVHEELELLVAKAGFRPLDALVSATLVPARHLGLAASLGTIEVGKLADLVLLAADPLRDIANVDAIDLVVLDGRVLDRSALAALATVQPEPAAGASR